jgi:ribosomal protein S18 acetylase RimI-like enzyme
MMINFVASWARGHGLARAIALAVEDEARGHSISVLNLDVRESQAAAIQLYQSLGYSHYGTHPRYARVDGQWVAGLFFWKDLTAAPSGSP